MSRRRYVNFKTYTRGVKGDNGKNRNCMNCHRTATTTAQFKLDHLTMDVRLCDEHAVQAKSVNQKGFAA